MSPFQAHLQPYRCPSAMPCEIAASLTDGPTSIANKYSTRLDLTSPATLQLPPRLAAPHPPPLCTSHPRSPQLSNTPAQSRAPRQAATRPRLQADGAVGRVSSTAGTPDTSHSSLLMTLIPTAHAAAAGVVSAVGFQVGAWLGGSSRVMAKQTKPATCRRYLLTLCAQAKLGSRGGGPRELACPEDDPAAAVG